MTRRNEREEGRRSTIEAADAELPETSHVVLLFLCLALFSYSLILVCFRTF